MSGEAGKSIQDYAFIGDCRTGALISSSGSLDWLCLPDFDSPACFASLIGSKQNGYWSICPAETILNVRRHYRNDSMILETIFTTESGEACLIDFMPVPGKQRDIIRLIKGIKGKVPFRMELSPRFEYGSMIPMIKWRDSHHAQFIRGADCLTVYSSFPLKEMDHSLASDWTVSHKEEFSIQLMWSPSHGEDPQELNVHQAINETHNFWCEWLRECHLDDASAHPDLIKRSVLILKALTCEQYGSIVAAPTCSLPEAIGESRNWDYRFCWPRDAAMAIRAVISSTGQRDEIIAWRDWLLRAVAGIPSQLSVLYTLDGSLAMEEREIPWLKGYKNSIPVRMGNLAQDQLQLDIYASVIEVFYLAEKLGLPPQEEAWDLVRSMLDYLETIWQEPDEGIWEVRGQRQHFVHSKLMVWAAYKWGIKAHEELGIKGNVNHWRKIQKEIHEDICRKGFNKERECFTQFYGSDQVDASLLKIPLLEFLPIDDPRVVGTIKKIEDDLLLEEGLLMRYLPDPEVEGLPNNGQRAFFLCSAWLGEVYVLQGHRSKAENILNKIVSLTNDVGLLSEQYDPQTRCFLGNFPQAFSHIALLRLELSLTERAKTDS